MANPVPHGEGMGRAIWLKSILNTRFSPTFALYFMCNYVKLSQIKYKQVHLTLRKRGEACYFLSEQWLEDHEDATDPTYGSFT